VKVEYTPTLISEIKSRGGGRIAIKAKQVGGATRTITVRVRLPQPVTG
jgi:chemotaxis receptor (MCP) glutamine deamidase CheD